MRILFFGTAEIACPVLQRLVDSENHEVVGVISQPDRPQGRKRKVAPSPVRALALDLEIPTYTPEKVGSEEVMELLEAMKPDVQVVVAYGQYIPAKVTDFPPYRSINLHPSKLPVYRGAAPVQWAIADGLEESAVTILYVSPKMDAGDIIAQAPVAIDLDDTTETLFVKMADHGGALLLKALEMIAEPDFESTPQEESEATHARKLTKEDRALDWSWTAVAVRNWIRACQPWPGTVFSVESFGEDSVKVLAAEVVERGEGEADAEPGTLLAADSRGPVVACGEGALCLTRVQPPGKKPMDGDAFLRGLRS